MEVLAGKAQKSNGEYRVPLELRSASEGRDVIHAKAAVVLANKVEPGAPEFQENGVADGLSITGQNPASAKGTARALLERI